MSALELLREARERIAKPENWTQCVLAEDEDGDEVDASSSEACRWCALGALDAGGPKRFGDWTAAISALGEALGAETDDSEAISDFNDSSEHSDVVALFDLAIEIVEDES